MEFKPTEFPHVTLLGPGFLSRANLAVGWSLGWRVGLANGLVSAILHGGLAWQRGSVTFDAADRLALFGITTVAGLLITDWIGRRVARRYYRLSIARFIGWSITWREAVATFAWGVAAALLGGGGVFIIRLAAPDGAVRQWLTNAWIVVIVLAVLPMAAGGIGWAAHRAFAQARAKSAAGGLTSEVTSRSSESRVDSPRT